jgi:predicted ABC-type transport system involved in lysophospholipase L1 biosynthesis ATPase subunit
MGNTNSSVSEDTDFFNNEGENPQVEVPHDPKHFVPTENAAREVQVLKNVKTESVSEDVWEIKIAVVGDEGVGKSSVGALQTALTNCRSLCVR